MHCTINLSAGRLAFFSHAKKIEELRYPIPVSWDWTKPHSAVNYPFGRGMGQSANDLERLLQWPIQKIRVCADADELWKQMLSAHGEMRRELLVQGPFSLKWCEAALSLGFRVVELSRDPEHFAEELEQHRGALVFLSNPNPWDSFDFPDEIWRQLITRALQAGCRVVADDSQAFFSFTETGPGRLSPGTLVDPKLEFWGSLKPVLKPQGENINYWLSQNAAPSLPQDPEASELASLLQGLSIRTGSAVQEFKRRMLEVHYSLKRITELLMPLKLKGKIDIPYFPQTGFYLIVDWRQALSQRQLSLQEGLDWLEQESAHKVLSGLEFRRPGHIALCFAQPLIQIEKHGPKLVQALDL
jgi:hypothetical protein